MVHSSDVLCVWAYVGQVRMDRLAHEFPSEVAVEYRYVSVSSATPGKLGERWRDKGGLAAYAEHVGSVVAKFDHVRLSPEAVDPRGADLVDARAPPALRGTAAGASGPRRRGRPDGGGLAGARGLLPRRSRRLRSGGAQGARQGGRAGRGRARRPLASGRAHAGSARDLDLAREQDIRVSPTLTLNDGRQRLSGNVGYRTIAANVREILEKPVEEASWC